MELLSEGSGCPRCALPSPPWPPLLPSVPPIVLEPEAPLLVGCCLPSPSERRDQALGGRTQGGWRDGKAGEGLPACAKHAVQSPCSFFIKVKSLVVGLPHHPQSPSIILRPFGSCCYGDHKQNGICKSTQAITAGKGGRNQRWGGWRGARNASACTHRA